MKNMVEDIYRALDAKAYLSALALSLTLPDVLAQIEYPELEGKGHVGQRYIRWIDEHYVTKPPSKEPDDADLVGTPILNELVSKFDGLFFFKLRCSFLHSGNNDISEAIDDLDFELSFEPTSATTVLTYEGVHLKHHTLSVPDFCMRICGITECLLDKWKDNSEVQDRLEQYCVRLRCFD